MNITKGLKAAAKAFVAGPKAESFRAGGKLVACAHCENALFHKKKASLNRAFSSLAGTEWLDKEACVLVCANCSRMEWFYEDMKPDGAEHGVRFWGVGSIAEGRSIAQGRLISHYYVDPHRDFAKASSSK